MADRIEIIDERILKLLKLEDEFEMSYGEYIRHLREALVAASLTKSIYSSEEAEMLRDEFKRVGTNKSNDRFTIKVKKFTVNRSIPKTNTTGAIKFLTGKKSKVEPNKSIAPQKQIKTISVLDIVLRISNSVNKIYQSLIEQNEILRSNNVTQRRERENIRRSRREDQLEKGPNKLIEATKKILSPLKSIWDRIFKFLLFTVLGRAFKKFLEWAKDPENKNRLKVLGRFLKDFFPAILGAYFLFANPLGKFVRVITSSIIKLTYKLSKFAIPKLLSFTKSHPLVASGVAIGAAVIGSQIWKSNEEKKLIDKEAEKRNTTPEKIKGELDTSRNSFASMFGEAMQNISVTGFRGGGVIPEQQSNFVNGFKSGGVFSGLVTSNTGQKVSGYGEDTQYLPMEDGSGGVVVKPGEIVMNQEQQQTMYKDTGIHPASYVPNPKSGNVQKYASGGVIGNNPNFWSLAAIAAKEAGSMPQGHADVAQSIYNRAKTGIYPGGKSIKGIITAANQYQPTFKNLNSWMNINDRSTATKAVGKDYVKSLDIAAKSLMNSSLQKNASKFIGSRTDFRGESQKSYMDTKKGDITRGTGHNFFGWMTDTSYNKKMESPAPIPSFIPKFNANSETKSNTSTKSNIPKFNANSETKSNTSTKSKPKQKRNIFTDIYQTFLPFKGGTTEKYGPVGRDGRINENTGKNVPGTDDRQEINIRVQPGEYLRVFTQNFVDKGGMKVVDYLQAMMDSDSNAKKEGVLANSPLNRYVPPPPSQSNGGIKMITLPPSVINKSKSVSNTSGNGEIPSINAIPVSGIFVRQSNAQIYGIMG
jgi:hypothetical protein